VARVSVRRTKRENDVDECMESKLAGKRYVASIPAQAKSNAQISTSESLDINGKHEVGESITWNQMKQALAALGMTPAAGLFSGHSQSRKLGARSRGLYTSRRMDTVYAT